MVEETAVEGEEKGGGERNAKREPKWYSSSSGCLEMLGADQCAACT